MAAGRGSLYLVGGVESMSRVPMGSPVTLANPISAPSRAYLDAARRLRGFTTATGTAPQRYLQQVRLEEAAALLGSTALPIKAVAAAVGFLSRSHFSRAFAEAFGIDPSAYRRKMIG